MSLTALTIGLVAFVLTGNVVAQGDPRACGDFDFSEHTQRVAAAEILKDLRSCDVRVINAIVDGDLIFNADKGKITIEHGLKFQNVNVKGDTDFTGATFEKDADFAGVIFEGDADFGEVTDFAGVTFEGDADFTGATFVGSAIFVGATFKGRAGFRKVTFGNFAEFTGATFEGDADFGEVTFEGGAGFRSTIVTGRLFFYPTNISGRLWPPTSSNIITGLTWNQVKGTFPPSASEIDMHGLWENFFLNSNDFATAGQVRTSRRRFELRVWIWTIAGSLVGGWLVFTALYYWRFRKVLRSSRLHNIGKVLLFSLDVISPSIRPWKYDWDDDGGLPVGAVIVITSIESAIGWVFLGLASAIAVAWLTA